MTGVVEVDCLTRRFGSRRGVTDVTFGIDAGEVFGFLGPNGAGKSTTIRLLLGLYRATSGRIRVFGLDPVRDAVAVHARAGYPAGDLALHPRLTGGSTWTGSVTPGVWTTPRTGTSSLSGSEPGVDPARFTALDGVRLVSAADGQVTLGVRSGHHPGGASPRPWRRARSAGSRRSA